MGEPIYEHYRRLIRDKAALVYYSLTPPGYFDVDDMEQEGYFIFLNAVKTHDASKGLPFGKYLWMKLHFGFKDYFRKTDYLSRSLSPHREEPMYKRPLPLDQLLEMEREWGLPEALKIWDDSEPFEEWDILERFWASFLEQLPYNHRVAFNVWRHTNSQVQAARASGLSEGRISQLMKQLDKAAIAWGEDLRKANG